jgi:DNA mismatch repair protein MutS
MINAGDLHIVEEIVPLFDFTYNSYASKEVKDILSTKLDSKVEILFRQELLKGFIANWEILKDYSYSRFNLSDIHAFFETIFIGSVATRTLRLRFMFSQKAREQKRGKLILLVRLFYAINRDYLTKINTRFFPTAYIVELEEIKEFFAAFDLDRYEKAFNKNKFSSRHMVELIMIITEKNW